MDNKQIVGCLKQIEENFYYYLNLISNKNNNIDIDIFNKLMPIIFETFNKLYSNNDVDNYSIILNFIKNINLKFEHNFLEDKFDNYTEYLFYISLIKNIPNCVNKYCYLSHKHKICNNKYVVDFALLDRETNNPLIIVKIDNYNNIVSEEQISKNNKIDREIQHIESVNVWHYTKYEIKNELDFLVKNFWDYVVNNII